ncbi:MAG TPA: penicillin-binding transpeptidase domain-containing protein [Candidatus Limnocylindria bacterium]|nr:penicillin-binding transpeptidase domain-containing protein [Candidatus Limnocylindria bacterium]
MSSARGVVMRWGSGFGAVTALAAAALLMAACSATVPDPTPYPTPAPRAAIEAADDVVGAFLQAWGARDYGDLYRTLAAHDRERYSRAEVAGILSSFDRLAGVRHLESSFGQLAPIILPPEPPPPDEPAPTPTPTPGPDATGASTPTPTPLASAVAAPSTTPAAPGTPLDGPVRGLLVPVQLEFATDNFGTVRLERDLILVESRQTWQVRWSPELLFPELGADGTLQLAREAPVRGRIVGLDGTVYARTRPDGLRVYPQDWLAGQTIGYATPAAARELRGRLERGGARDGDLLGRSGLELGADELLRGSAGFTLSAAPAGGDPVTVLERPVTHGSDVVITLRQPIQATAQDTIGGYAEAGTAVIDPRSGDVWALASAPLFNPNAMTLGTTAAGVPLATPGEAAITNHATDGTYPTGSSFKVFTLAAALQTGVAGPATRMTCNGTWTFSGFTFRNYLEHSLPGTVDLLEAMAFSCNTTYMPLSIMVYERDERALTQLVRDFGFGQETGMRYLPHDPGILPDHAYFRETPRWHGETDPYGPFDQIQLSIGQGSLLASPLQMANAYAAIGNGGRLFTPRLVAEVRSPDGQVTERLLREVGKRIPLTRGQLDYVVESMQAVVSYSYGTAYGAFLGFGVPVAGKSGTAETGGPDPNAWFPAIAPANNPSISVATVLVRVPLATGGSDAAPLVRQVMARHFAD